MASTSRALASHAVNDTPTPSPRRSHAQPDYSTTAASHAYPPMLASPRSLADKWDTPTSSSSSSSSSHSSHTLFARSPPPPPPPQQRQAQARLGGSGRGGEDEQDEDNDMVAIDVFSIARDKAKNEKYGGESDDYDGDGDGDAHEPMLGDGFDDSHSGGVRGFRLDNGSSRTSLAAVKRRRRVTCLLLGVGTLVVAAFAGHRAQDQVVPPGWTFDKLKENGANWLGGGAQAMSGGDGSTVRMANGKTFVYRNQFGGHWNATPFSTAARAQSYTPSLSELWDWSNERIYGVNLGGWLNLEPFITPAIFEPFLDAAEPATDEWTFSVNLGDRLAEVLEHHYDTFVTEQDFADMAAAGLNWVRIPVPFWAIDSREGEPFLPNVSWKYFIKALGWARKYGLRVNVDLHTAPGSQNGWNHSGRNGPINFMNGVMGIVNGQRTLNIVRALAGFICLPENSEVIQMFTILNEAYIKTIGTEALRSFYLEAYKVVRGVCGYGAGNGPMLVIHDGFKGTRMWYSFAPGTDRIALESHRYLAFRNATADSLDLQALRPCDYWGGDFNRTMLHFGLGMSGEWSIATNDCGPFVNGVFLGTRYEGAYPNATHPDADKPGAAPRGACAHWENSALWDEETKEGLRDVALAHMDAFQNWFYWTWKTGPSLGSDRPANPMWSYSLGIKENYIPADPRTGNGFCSAHYTEHKLGPIAEQPFDRPLLDWQIGAGDPSQLAQGVDQKAVRKFAVFPPPKIGVREDILDTATLPSWRRGQGREGEIRLSGPRPEGAAEPVLYDAPWWVEMEGCEYLPPWEGVGVPVPEGACVAASA